MSIQNIVRKSIALPVAALMGCATLLTLAPSVFAFDEGSTNADGLTFSVTSPTSSGPTQYIVAYAEVNNSAPGDWFELPYQGSYTFKFTGSGPGPITLSDAAYFISPTEIPLDDLNLTDEPPPGNPGSPFTPLPSFDGILAPGSSDTASSPDGGATVVLLGLATTSLAALRSRVCRKS